MLEELMVMMDLLVPQETLDPEDPRELMDNLEKEDQTDMMEHKEQRE